MTSTKVEAGQRAIAETGFGNVKCLGSYDTPKLTRLRPAPQVAIIDRHCSVVAVVSAVAARRLVREGAMRSNAHVRPLAAEIPDLIDQIIECCAGHDYELEILQRVWREAEQAFCKARHEARTLSCTERNSHDPRDAA